MLIRPRILRQSDAIRRMVQETWLTPDDFIVPLFIDEGENFTEEMLSAKGIASGKEISVLAIGFIVSGHAIHHQNVIRERYL